MTQCDAKSNLFKLVWRSSDVISFSSDRCALRRTELWRKYLH